MKEWENFSTCGIDALDLEKKKKMDNHRRIRDDNENYYGITMITCYIAEWIQITLK